jgi:polysaccharide biosynthesis transport protein
MPSSNKRKNKTPSLAPLSVAWMIWKWRWTILAASVVPALAGIIYVTQMPSVYRADTLIVVDSQKIPEKFVSATVQASLNEMLGSISQQALSTARLQKIIDDFGLYKKDRATRSPEDVIAQFRQDLPLTLERGLGAGRPGAFRITFEGPDAKVVAAVVNRVSSLFVEENRATRTQRSEGTSDFLDAQLRDSKAILDKQEQQLRQFKLQWTGELPQQEGALMGALSRLNTELTGNQDQLNRAQQNKIMLENMVRLAESTLAATLRASEVQATRQAVAGHGALKASGPRRSEVLAAELSQAETRYTDDHPEVHRLRRELAQTVEDEKEAAERIAALPPPSPEAAVAAVNLPPDVAAQIKRERDRIAESRVQLGLVNKEIEQRNAERSKILAETADYQRRLDRLPIREQQMGAITRDYENTKANYRSLLDKKMSAQLANDMERQNQSERFMIADPARVPTQPVKPRRAVLYGLAIVGALLLCTALALAFELYRNTFRGEWELPHDVVLIGRIGMIAPEAAPVLRSTRT